MKKFIIRIWKYIKHPNPCCMSFNNERETFVFGNLAFVKCHGCGGESIPWPVSKEKAGRWRKIHPNYMELFNSMNKKGHLDENI
jgi:hypothetical protein